MCEQYLREIETLYVKQYEILSAYALRKLQNPSLAEEAVQETFRIACQKAQVLHKHERKEGWLLNTLRYVIANIERKQIRANKSLAEYIALFEKLNGKHNEIDVDVMYRDIASSEEYMLIKEFVLEQKSVRELAEKRGISVDACKKRIQRAKQQLRERLAAGDKLD